MGMKKNFRHLVAAMLTMAGAGVARAGENWIPLLPDQDMYDFQLFAPPDLREYSIWADDGDGVYFNYDRLYWGITVPRVVDVAKTQTGVSLIPSNPIAPSTIVDLNNDYLDYQREFPITIDTTIDGINNTSTVEVSAPQSTIFTVGGDPLKTNLNTSWMRTKMTWGNRFEGGWSYDGRGMEFSYLQLGSQAQQFATINELAANSPSQDVTVDFGNSGGGGNNNNTGGGGGGGAGIASVTIETTTDSPPPDHLITQALYQTNETTLQGGSAAFTIRRQLSQRKGGTQATFSFGPRFIQFAERYKLNYASFQNSFNTTAGGGGGLTNNGGNNTGGGQGGAGQGGGGNQGGNQGGGLGGGGTGGNNNTGGGGVGGNNNNQGGNGNLTGGNTPLNVFGTGDIASYQLGGAGQVGITTGNLPSTLTGEGPGSIFQAAAWETYTSNNMVGPEFGLFFQGQKGRWSWLAGGKFTAGFNWQNNIYRGANMPADAGADYLRTNFAGAGLNSVDVAVAGGGLGTGTTNTTVVSIPNSPMIVQLFPTGQVNATNETRHRFVFSPVGEWRFGTQFKVSQAISLNFGYTGMWLSQIARASSNTAYETTVQPVQTVARNTSDNPIFVNPAGQTVTGPGPGITEVPPKYSYTKVVPGFYNQIAPQEQGNEYVFTNGIDFGVEIKY